MEVFLWKSLGLSVVKCDSAGLNPNSYVIKRKYGK